VIEQPIGIAGVPPLRFVALNFIATFGLAMLALFTVSLGTVVYLHKRKARRFAVEQARPASLASSDGALSPL
jgi:membrane protein DedA with SNARE-associated domain